MELLAADPRIDIIVVYENADILSRFLGRAMTNDVNTLIIDFAQKQTRPVVVVLPPGSLETDRLDIESRVAGAGIPVYPSMERAAQAIRNVNQYWRFRAAVA